jgi:arylsulfatase A-like enzyme
MSALRRVPLLCARVLAVALALAMLRPAPVAAAPPSAGERPNLVFILADDLGLNDLSCYGRKDQATPRLDQLARQGIRFTASYCAQSICSPTRAALLTGQTPARLHLTTFLPGRPDAPSQLLLHPRINMQLPRSAKTVAELLKPAGYTSACLGKWHLGEQGSLPTDRGFDVYFPGHANTRPSATEGGKGELELTTRAEKFIEENKDRPFFLYLAHNNPHIPLAARPELIAKHKDAFNPVYAAMIETLDDCVGRVVAKVDALGLAERTLIVFTSDNGGLHVLESPHTPATHNTPFRAGKGFCYEGGLRVPLIVRWPGKVKAGVADTPVISTDWAPTLLEVAGITHAGKLDGISLAGLLTRGEALPPRPLYWHLPHYTNQGSRPAGAIRRGDWKLVEQYEDGRCELFDLAHDRGESTDLAGKEPARVADLRGQLEKWRREVGAQENTANPNFDGRAWRRLYHDVDPSCLPLETTASAMAAKLEPWRAQMNAVLRRPSPADPLTVAPGPGVILLHAREAKVHGSKLRYEPEPHKDTLGFWTQPGDWVEWEFETANAGLFEVELLQGCGKGSGGAEVEVTVGGQTLAMKVEETGHFQRFVPRTAGTAKLERPGRFTLTVMARSKPGVAVMDLRRIVLRAAR